MRLFLGGEGMLHWALIFLVITLVAALFGFTGILIGISAARRIP